jgi:hypothetical protein
MAEHLRWMPATLAGVAGLALLTALPGRGAEYTVHVVEPAITDRLILAGEPLPPVCREAGTLHVSACRGEYEPASFVLSAAKPLTAVRIEVGALRGPGGEWPGNAVDARLVQEAYRPFCAGSAVMPTLLVHDGGLLALEPAPTPEDPAAMKLVAKGPRRDADELQPVDVPDRRQFWITVHVPETAEAGTYETSVRVLPANDQPVELRLQVEVYPFTLLPSMLEYSIYHPVYLDADFPAGHTYKFADIAGPQYEAELRDLLAHGVDNPDMYTGVTVRADGTLDYAKVERVVELRRRAGLRPRCLYLLGHPLVFVDRPLTPDERERNHRYVREINAWAAGHGFAEVYFAANDEWWGEKLRRESDSLRSVQEAGGKTFVAVMGRPDFFDLVGEVLTRPVLEAHGPQGHMELYARETKSYNAAEQVRRADEIAQVGIAALERLAQDPDYERAISGVHRLGRKILSYSTYRHPLPAFQRRREGLALWRLGFDGNKDWAYTHITGDRLNQTLGFAMVYRTDGGVLDTLHWEGFREGVDDVRYLTTLLDALGRAGGRYPTAPLVSETVAWLGGVDVFHGDLDAIRRELARRTMALQDLGPRTLTPEQVLAGVAVAAVRVVALPEPWRWKMDPDDKGVREAWFASGLDDSAWQPMRTDTEAKGWGSDTGYGWYRNVLPLSAEQAATAHAYLYFGACDEDAWVYVNGKELLEHSCRTTGLLDSEIWDRPFVVPLTGVKLDGNDLLAVRVLNRSAMGGIWKPVRLVLSPQELSVEQVRALIATR